MKIKNIFLLLSSSIVFLSCSLQKPKQEINYMKDIEQIAVETSVKNTRSTIQPGDQLEIYVTAKDMDVTAPFNQNYSAAAVTAAAQSQARPSGGDLSPVSATGPKYTVDTDGNINMNVLGKISTAGLTTEDLRDELEGRLTRYIKNPVVNIRYLNYKITVMGEVARPDTYVVPDGKITLLNALSLAGDLTQYGVRDNILVVRNVDGEISNYRVDLTSANFMNSPAFNLKQNDVIYVTPNATKEKVSRMDPNTQTYIAVGSIIVSLASVLILLVRR